MLYNLEFNLWNTNNVLFIIRVIKNPELHFVFRQSTRFDVIVRKIIVEYQVLPQYLKSLNLYAQAPT